MRPSNALKELHQQHLTIRDRLRAVVHGRSNGFYLCGRPGTSKTYTIRTALKEWAVPYEYRNGSLSAIGLFDLLDEHHDRTIVLDDIANIFGNPQALQIFLAALGTPFDGSRERWVRHKTANGDRSVRFTGGIVAISNLPLEGNAVVNAVRDRVHLLQYEPTDEQIVAQIFEIAATGPRGVSPKNAKTVAQFLVTNLPEGMRPTIRLFVDKALPSFSQWSEKLTESHWTDLVLADIKEQPVALTHQPRDLSRAEQVEAERRIVLAICHEHEDREARVKAWQDRTGKSQAAFYRRMGELKKEGRLDRGA